MATTTFRNNMRITGNLQVDGSQTGQTRSVPVSVTAVATTGAAIPADATFVSVTSANSAHIVILPPPVPGKKLYLHVGANGFALRSSAPATVAINGGTGASASSAIAADTLVEIVCTTATTWQGWRIVGATLSAVPAAA
jgi:hypothetical protein